MTSTFHSLETARRALASQQSALMTTGHNIANANTPGYTRQRVNLETTTPFPGPGLNRPQIPGNIGTGVQVGNVQRIRDSFVDTQYRTETSKLGYWEAKAGLLSQIESIMNEPSDIGLANTMDQFWSSLQDLATQPQDSATRAVVRQTGIALSDTFNYIYSSLEAVQQNYRNELNVSEQNVNSIIRQINQVNKQIGSVEPHGLTPNDLYDERDRLVDELSTMVNIKFETKSSGGNAVKSAEGLYDIYVTTPEGDILKDSTGKPLKLIDSDTGTAVGFHIQYENRQVPDSPISQIKFFQLDNNEPGFAGLTQIDADTNENPIFSVKDLTGFNTNGKLRGIIEGYGYQKTNGDGKTDAGMINEMLAQLDTMAYTFATQFNLVHSSGWSPEEIHKGENSNQDFFSFTGIPPTKDNLKGAAARITVSSEILMDLNNIAAAAEGNVLSGVMAREEVSSEVTGNPFITGIYAEEEGLAFEGKIKLTLTNSGVGEGSWSYTLSGLDAEGNELTKTDTLPIDSTETSATILGVNIDVSQVKNLQGDATWTYEFNAEGLKSSDEAFIGNGSNALKMAEVKDTMLNYGGSLTDVQSYYQGMIGELGDRASEANRMTQVAGVLQESVGQNRMSMSSVSLDEEMADMIKFQHAYNAAARYVTLVDELLDKVVNGMGVVGR